MGGETGGLRMNLTDGVELKLLLAAVIIGLVQLVWATVASVNKDRNLPWLLSPRDEQRPATGVAARLDRAFANFMETFPLFAAALIAALLAGKQGDLTVWGSGLYVAGRALYVPLYAAGVPVARTLVWTASIVGLILVVAAFFQ